MWDRLIIALLIIPAHSRVDRAIEKEEEGAERKERTIDERVERRACQGERPSFFFFYH